MPRTYKRTPIAETPQHPTLLTFAEIASATGVSVSSLHSARLHGHLSCWRIGLGRSALYVVEASGLKAWLETYQPRSNYRTRGRIAAGLA